MGITQCKGICYHEQKFPAPALYLADVLCTKVSGNFLQLLLLFIVHTFRPYEHSVRDHQGILWGGKGGGG